MYSIVQPALNVQRDKESISSSLELGILKKLSYDMTTGTISLENTLGSGCVQLEDAITALGIGKNIVVKEGSGTILNSYISSSGENDILVQGTSSSGNLLKIGYSSILNEAETLSLTCTELQEGEGYTIGLVKTQKYLFEIKMIELIEEYHTQYEELKAELNILEGMEFGYGLVLSNGTIIETNGGEPTTNIYVQQTPIQYVNVEGNIVAGYIETKIW